MNELSHALCGQGLEVRAREGGASELWCPACGPLAEVRAVGTAPEYDREATGQAVVRYLSERYNIGAADAFALVSHHWPQLFDGIDAHRPAREVGDELAAAADLPVRVPVSLN